MKRMLAVLVVVLLLGLSNYGMAQDTEDTEDTRTSVTIGLKTWYATWEYKPVGEEDIDYGTGLMYGLALNIRSGSLFVGLNYLMGGGFTYEESETIGNWYYTYEYEADRTDIDLSLGYYFHPNLALFLGYKTLTIASGVYETLTSSYYDDITYESEWEVKLAGPAFGLAGYARIGESRMILFGTLSYVSLESEVDGVAGESFTGPAIEAGLAYALETIPASVTFGYKYQSYTEDVEEGGQDVFAGLTLGLNFSF
jgi:hypothetical protein